MAHSEIPLQVILDMLADGQSVRQIAKAIGRDESSVRGRIKRAAPMPAPELPEGVKAAIQASGTAPGVASHGWIKTKGKEPGDTEHSVFWKAPPQQVPDLANALREALTDIPRAPARRSPPAVARDDRLVLLPLPDAHVGMFAWGRESGDSYDVAIAEDQIVGACCDLIDRTGGASELVLLNLGDFLHAENDNARTPMSQHALDVDGRQYRTMQAAIRITATVIDYARETFPLVTYRALPGNHDPMGAIAIALAMGQRYYGVEGVVVEDNPAPFWFRRFGTTMLGAHHGDGVKPERLVMHMADTRAQDWAATNWRYYFTGHLHHHASREIGGVQWEQLRAIAPKDAWATKHAYVARRSIQAITYDARQGEIARSSANI